MKFYITILISVLTAFSLKCQTRNWTYNLTFDDLSGLKHLYIDTTSNPNNIWQIGRPQKSVFSSAYSPLNAIVTDTISPYPNNDTSIFIIKNTAGGGSTGLHTVSLRGYYYVNSDSLKDFGIIEYSHDNGNSWINLLQDTITIDTLSQHWVWYWEQYGWNKPVLSGNSNGWIQFSTNLALVAYANHVNYGDTVLFRFTFISDSIQTNKAGLMFDDLYFDDYYEGIPEFQYNLSLVSPNPFSQSTRISFNQSYNNIALEVYNLQGQLVAQDHYENSKGIVFERKGLSEGMYFLKLRLDGKRVETRKIMVSE
jgi:hypothetical protein